MTNFLRKSQNTILGPFWVLFSQIWPKMKFPGQKRHSVLKYLDYLLSYHPKKQKN